MSAGAADTIYALSSGNLPAAIGVFRVSGPAAATAIQALAGSLPEPRRAKLAALRHPDTQEVIDYALILFFPGPRSETGEDLAEFHIHGGRAVADALAACLAALPGLRQAEPGEFTRRSFENGKLDLTGVEGLADLVFAETQSQRRAALAMAGGALSRRVEQWQERLLGLAARLEATLDFSDEGEVGEGLPAGWDTDLGQLIADIGLALAAPPAERLRDGVRVVIAGPPNAGKSTLFNALCGREAAITSHLPGTTRDIVEAPTAIAGTPLLLIDTAGLRESVDLVESIGIERAESRIGEADIILWLGEAEVCPDPSRSILVRSKVDLLPEGQGAATADAYVSPVTGAGMEGLLDLLLQRSRALLPREGEAALNARHRDLLKSCVTHLKEAAGVDDLLVAAEALRQARRALDQITGKAGVEDMLDALFGRLCIGK